MQQPPFLMRVYRENTLDAFVESTGRIIDLDYNIASKITWFLAEAVPGSDRVVASPCAREHAPYRKPTVPQDGFAANGPDFICSFTELLFPEGQGAGYILGALDSPQCSAPFSVSNEPIFLFEYINRFVQYLVRVPIE
jgi:hypothetical protein